ncbi:CrcB family protein (plasmid) [Aliisedimentitalea scapharcae]|uniref:Fluoride-specific ion channel FluC n=1 Tax=Aliisedimentitalea scapharcae TaxID=1524259 RepID=A0ABZ2XYD0_9RHOB
MNRGLMYLAVFVGGAFGSVLREVFSAQIPGLPFLSATFAINVTACLVLGYLYAIRHRVHAHIVHLGAVGFCGGLSTFSSFMAEIARFAADGSIHVITAPGMEILCGLGAAMIGETIGRWMYGGGRFS